MSFLTPLFLLGAAAVVLPVLFHLIRHSPRIRQEFGSLIFLSPSPPRLARKSRLEHLLLLILRCLVLCLLALGFARPYFKAESPAAYPEAPGRRLLLLLDVSASMRRESLWADARQKAEAVLKAAAGSDQAAVYSFDSQCHAIATFDEWKAAEASSPIAKTVQRLSSLSPGWGSTHLGQALVTAAEILETENVADGSRAGQIVVISDLQSGSRLDALSSCHWPKNVQVLFEPVRVRNPGNAGIQIAAPDPAAVENDGMVRIKVTNSPESRKEQFKVGWAGPVGNQFDGPAKDIYVPPGQTRTLTLPLRADKAESGRLLLAGDDHDFDNTAHWVAPRVRKAVVYCLSKDRESDRSKPYFFLKQAFQQTRAQAVQVKLAAPGEDSSSLLNIEAAMAASTLIVVADELPDALARSVRSQLTGGKTALVAVRSTGMSRTAGLLLGLDSIPMDERSPSQYVILGDIDFRHPLFQPFADPRFSDFTRIHFWKYRRMTVPAAAGARVLARFDTGEPAILEAPAGKGRIVLFASNWHPEDSQLALSTKFVPLLYSLLDSIEGAAPVSTQYELGQSIPIENDSSKQAASFVTKPDGARVQSAEIRFNGTDLPGVYCFEKTANRFAVNLDPSESRTSPLAVEDFEQMGVPVRIPKTSETNARQNEAIAKNAELESRQKLWQWLILGTLALALAESWLAGRISHRPSISNPTML